MGDSTLDVTASSSRITRRPLGIEHTRVGRRRSWDRQGPLLEKVPVDITRLTGELIRVQLWTGTPSIASDSASI